MLYIKAIVFSLLLISHDSFLMVPFLTYKRVAFILSILDVLFVDKKMFLNAPLKLILPVLLLFLIFLLSYSIHGGRLGRVVFWLFCAYWLFYFSMSFKEVLKSRFIRIFLIIFPIFYFLPQLPIFLNYDIVYLLRPGGFRFASDNYVSLNRFYASGSLVISMIFLFNVKLSLPMRFVYSLIFLSILLTFSKQNILIILLVFVLTSGIKAFSIVGLSVFSALSLLPKDIIDFIALRFVDNTVDVANGENARGTLVNLFKEGLDIPLLGLGPGVFEDSIGMATHNAFLNLYASIGVISLGFFVLHALLGVLILLSRNWSLVVSYIIINWYMMFNDFLQEHVLYFYYAFALWLLRNSFFKVRT